MAKENEAPEELSELELQRLTVDHLRQQARIKPIKISEAIEDMKLFVAANEAEDAFVSGFSSQRPNPFREKKTCIVL